ncbi:EthD domain-containing protein [Conexibacter stalactiti]|uniref:EthD domain-containing protein n=1 Tax=Conexibacter stalactiti TaxID=1940611 RepID=A0ABU4HNM0_9ACTN|nr:EthD domain-containing protein [Conexibacter stalactiti]MDW5594864.1 EthD domain-containing protein [Conexibacter stalactiti]MEC5035506.1 EthD domain-containing protein [Conexibacter stalactiti]
MTSPSPDRVSLQLAAQHGEEELLRAHVRQLAEVWAAALGPEVSVRATVRRPVTDLAETHFRELLPNLRPFDATLDAWGPARLKIAATVGALVEGLAEPVIDERRSRILVGRQMDVKEGDGPFVVTFLQNPREDFSREQFLTRLRERHVTIALPDDPDGRPVANRLAGFRFTTVDGERSALAAEATGLAAAPFHALSEPHYDDVAHFRSVTCDPAVRTAVTADELEFLDHERSAATTSETIFVVRAEPAAA